MNIIPLSVMQWAACLLCLGLESALRSIYTAALNATARRSSWVSRPQKLHATRRDVTPVLAVSTHTNALFTSTINFIRHVRLPFDAIRLPLERHRIEVEW